MAPNVCGFMQAVYLRYDFFLMMQACMKPVLGA
jgi:hypothetical protein